MPHGQSVLDLPSDLTPSLTDYVHTFNDTALDSKVTLEDLGQLITVDYYKQSESDALFPLDSETVKTVAQTLTDSQKAQVLANIGANKSLISSLPDGAQFLIEGDSIFSDLSVSQSSHPPRWGSFFQTSKLFAERGFIYTNSAVPGNGLVELEARFAATGAAQAVATGTATVIVCNVGVNDLAAGEMEGAPWANAAAWIADYETLAQSYQALSTSEHPVYFVACTMVKYRNKDALRKQVNDLIRTSKVFDMVVDHALILTDEDDLNFYIPNTSGGASPTDETHPNERGAYYQFREIMRRLFPEVAPLAQENLLTSFEGLYSRNGQIPRNFATLKVFTDDAQASVGGLGYRDAYLKSTGEMVVVMTAPPTITTHNWTEASNSRGFRISQRRITRLIMRSTSSSRLLTRLGLFIFKVGTPWEPGFIFGIRPAR
jgi:hypothetical protein